ncbi:MAG: hypothetical protein ABI779_23805 [Acidobacteriota bacterium]
MNRLFAVALLLAVSTAARADGGLDLAVLVDQPTSMSPRTGTPGVLLRIWLVRTQTAENTPAKSDPVVDTLIVPPYLEIIVFDIFRASRNAAIEIRPPHSLQPIRAGVDGVESVLIGDVMSTLVVPHPAPGEWTILKSHADARVRILSQQFFPRGALLRPAQTDTLRRCDPIPLAYRVMDGNGRPLEELPGYAVSLEMILAKPNGTTVRIDMKRDPALGAGVFRGANDIVAEMAGRYWTDVRILTTDAGSHRLQLFRDRWSGFSVAPGPRTRCSAQTAPAAGGARPLFRSSTTIGWIAAALLISIAVAAAWIRKTKS